MKSLMRTLPLFLFLIANVTAQNVSANQNLHINPVKARAVVQLTSLKVDTCENADGEEFTLTRLTGQGPITSEDLRLAGTFFADAKILHNSDGVGISHDDFQIRDSQTGRLKVKGSADALDADPEAIKGMAIADLADGTRFWSESTVRLPAPGTQDPIIIEYGGNGPDVPADRAVTISGNCRHFFEDD